LLTSPANKTAINFILLLGLRCGHAMFVHEKHSQDNHAIAMSPGVIVCRCVCYATTDASCDSNNIWVPMLAAVHVSDGGYVAE
jgi:hypothetical protein